MFFRAGRNGGECNLCLGDATIEPRAKLVELGARRKSIDRSAQIA